MNPDVSVSVDPVYPWEILKRLTLDENRLCCVIYWHRAPLWFQSIKLQNKTRCYFNRCKKKCICECTGWGTFSGLPDLSCDVHSWKLDFRKMYRPIGTRLSLATNFRLRASTNCTSSSMSVSSEHLSSCVFQWKQGLCPSYDVRHECNVSWDHAGVWCNWVESNLSSYYCPGLKDLCEVKIMSLELCLWKGNIVKYIRINDAVRHMMPDNIWQCVAYLLHLGHLFGHVLCLLTISQGELFNNSAWETPLLLTALLTPERTWVGIISFSLCSYFPIRCEGKWGKNASI